MKTNEVNSFKKMLWMSVMVPMLLSLSLFSGETVSIMPLGDSITHEDYRDPAIDATIPNTDRSSYRNDLWYALQGGNYTVDFVGGVQTGQDVLPAFDVDHEGHNGLLDSEMAANVYGYLTANPADIVLLHIGTNGQILDNGADDVENTLKEIDRYESDNNTHVKVILSRIINCRSDWDNAAAGKTEICDDAGVFSSKITEFNNLVETMAQTRIENGDDIVIVDMENNAGFVYDATDMIDDLHPNDAGYTKMANVWYSALVDNIPTHLWKLEEAAQPFVDTYRDANGICVAGCPAQDSGIIGSAQSFNGTDSSIDVSDDDSFDWAAGQSFTVEFWMKPESTTNLQVAIGRRNGSSNNWWVGREGTKVKVSMGDSITSTTDIDTSGNQWTHVAVVKDVPSSKIRLYINGVEDSNIVDTSGDFSGTDPVNIGWFYNGYYFDGALDEMTVYNGVLNADQIKQHFERVVTGITLAITSTPVTSAELNAPYTYDVNSNDPSATFSLTTNPGWMEIMDSSTGVITGIPTSVGNDSVTVTADNGSQTTNQNFVVKVRDTASLPSSIQHYWKLDESDPIDETYIDSYNGATDATCATGCPMQVLGQVNNAQAFDGVNSSLDAPDDDSFDWAAGQSFTVEFWMKPESTTNLQVAIGRRNGSSNNWWVGREGTKVKVSMGDSITSTTDIDTSGNQWTHVAVVKDVPSSKIRLYINGVEDSNIVDTSGDFSGTDPVNIGWFYNGYYFDGALDEIVIFNSVLPANEISTHYQNGLAGNGFDNPDITKPVITLLGTTPIDVAQGSVYTDAGATASDDVDGDITANIVTVNPVDTSTLGQYTVTYDVNDSAGNAAVQVTRTVNVVDAAIPVITLLGTTPIDVAQGSVYTDAGATASDDVDGDITANIVTVNPVDTSTLGQYTVTYDVNDSAGNAAVQVTRTVNVVDAAIPVITLLGTTPIDVAQGSVYTDAGATASDDVDGDITANIVTVNPVDTSTLGQYTVTYDVNDSAGNAAVQVTRTVNVVDAAIPVITLLGTTPIDVAQGSVYTDAGATASDDVDGDITANIVTVNPVDTSTLGQYTVTYDVNDSAGNAAVQVTRTVNVVDAAIPVITLLGTTPIDVAQGSVYTDAGATASDDVDGDITANIVTVNPVDTSTLGQYTVTYDVNDSAGNAAVQVTRTVNVVVDTVVPDTTAPIVAEIIAVRTPTSDTTPSYSFSSSEDGNITYGGSCSSGTTTATAGWNVITFNALADGIYSDCTITVTDTAGNPSTPLAVTEFVVDTSGGTTGGGGCTYNPNSKNFDISFLFMMALGLLYPFRRRFIK